MADALYDELLRVSIEGAFRRLEARLGDDAPSLRAAVASWTRSLAGGGPPERYFTAPTAFPILLVPWWLERSLGVEADPRFWDDLADATVTGYLAVRLIDDLMDGDADVPAAVTPAIIVLLADYRSALASRFPPGHPFWDDLDRWSVESAEWASADADLRRIDRATFERICARKTVGAKIPISAVVHHHEHPADPDAWFAFVDALGRWHQMANDLRDWARDLASGRVTYFLSEAATRAGAGGSLGAWVVEEGLAWGYAELDRWMADLRTRAATLGSPSLAVYLELRAGLLDASRRRVIDGLPALRQLADLLR